MSGGAALSAAAVDHRIRAVIAQVPFVSGGLQSATFAPIIPGLFANRLDIKAGNPSARIPIVASSLEEARSGQSRAVLGQADAYEFMMKVVKEGGKWENHVTMQSMFHVLCFEPQATIHRIAPTPLLMVVADSDTCIPTADQLATYQKALEPKELHVLRNVGHFDVYDGPGFEDNVKVQINFLTRNL
jgi:cephalosporin-C deacetylase-like acetyl esterase